jgi:CheY-like chemotaxis protein
MAAAAVLPSTAATLIAVTGYGQAEDRQRSAQAGFDHHLVKPVVIEELAALLAGIDAKTDVQISTRLQRRSRRLPAALSACGADGVSMVCTAHRTRVGWQFKLLSARQITHSCHRRSDVARHQR